MFQQSDKGWGWGWWWMMMDDDGWWRTMDDDDDGWWMMDDGWWCWWCWCWWWWWWSHKTQCFLMLHVDVGQTHRVACNITEMNKIRLDMSQYDIGIGTTLFPSCFFCIKAADHGLGWFYWGPDGGIGYHITTTANPHVFWTWAHM